jgi:CubicO group peptidase (beta-lactamase class C family)
VAAFAEQVASAAVKAFNVTGLSLGVVCNHSTVYVGGFGFEDREQRVPATADTLYQVASNSKAFTAMVALQMAGEGRLSLDGPARDGE